MSSKDIERTPDAVLMPQPQQPQPYDYAVQRNAGFPGINISTTRTYVDNSVRTTHYAPPKTGGMSVIGVLIGLGTLALVVFAPATFFALVGGFVEMVTTAIEGKD